MQVFYDATCVFSGSKYTTSNLYFEQVCGIKVLLNQEMNSSDAFLKRMATQMLGKFEKYWSEHSLILAIAVVFDPRYKLQFVEYCYNKLYGVGSTEASYQFMRIREQLFALFDEYNTKDTSRSLTSHGCGDDISHEGHGMDFTKVELI